MKKMYIESILKIFSKIREKILYLQNNGFSAFLMAFSCNILKRICSKVIHTELTGKSEIFINSFEHSTAK